MGGLSEYRKHESSCVLTPIQHAEEGKKKKIHNISAKEVQNIFCQA